MVQKKRRAAVIGCCAFFPLFSSSDWSIYYIAMARRNFMIGEGQPNLIITTYTGNILVYN